MKCPHCGSEWSVSSQITAKVNNCPFCGNSLQPEEKKPETLEAALRLICQKMGPDPLRNGKMLISLHSDLMPDRHRDRRLLTHLMNCDGNAFLLNALKKPAAEQSTAICRLAKQLTEDWMIQPAAVCEVCGAFWLAAGGSAEALKGLPQKLQPQRMPEKTESAKTPSTKTASAKKPSGKSASAKSSSGKSASSASSVSAQTPVSKPEFFEIHGNILTKYKGKESVVRVPAGIRVIGNSCFGFLSGVREIILPEGVETIDTSAFAYCRDLERITFPGSLKRIGICAFQNCEKLTRIDLPSGLCNLDGGAFLRCSGLTEITIPGSISAVRHRAFGECGHLQKVVLQAGVQRLDKNCFLKCRDLRTIVIPDTVQDIHELAFEGCFRISVQSSALWKRTNPRLLGYIEHPRYE